MNSIPLLFVIFGGMLCITSIVNVTKLTYYDVSSGYKDSWGMWEAWFVKARMEGWFREGRKSNLWSALIGATLFAAGMFFLNGTSVSTRGQDLMLLVSGFALLIGVAGRALENTYSVGMKTMRWAGIVGVFTSLSMIFG